MADEAGYLRDQKLDHIKRDYERARSTVGKLGDRVNTIRTWNITVIVAYLGWMSHPNGPKDIWPLAGAVCGFWIMEALAHASARFFGVYTLAKADELFSSETLREFNKSIERYKFLDKARESQAKRWLGINGRVRRVIGGLSGIEMWVFYIVPLAAIVAYDQQWRKWADEAARLAAVLLVEPQKWAYQAARLGLVGLLIWYWYRLRDKTLKRYSIQEKWDENYRWKEERNKRGTIRFSVWRFVVVRRFVTVLKSVIIRTFAVVRCRFLVAVRTLRTRVRPQ